MHGMNIKR